MAKIAKKEYVRPIIEKKQYSKQELEKFDDLIQKYYEEYVLITGEKVMVLNKNKLAVSFGAMTRGTYLGQPYYSILMDPVEDAKRYEEFENIMYQWGQWKGKKEFINKKEVEYYEKHNEIIK